MPYPPLCKKKIPQAVYPSTKFITTILIIAGLTLPSIASPPDFLYQNNQSSGYDSSFINSAIKNPLFEDLNLTEGKQIVTFFSPDCQYCKLSSKKISVIAKKFDAEENVKYIFLGDEKKVEAFWEETESTKFQYKVIPVKEFFEISGSQLPAIYLFDNGEVKAKFGYRTIDEKEINEFFTSDSFAFDAE